MKTIFRRESKLLFILFIIATFHSNSQTWVNSTFYSMAPTVNNDTLNVGPTEMSSANDNHVYALVHIDQDQTTHLFSYDSAGNYSDIPLTHSLSISSEDAFSLHACPDNGCVYTTIHMASFYHSSKVYRMSPGATGQMWFKDYNPGFLQISPYVYQIIPTYRNTSIVRFGGDSLNEIDQNGNVIHSLQNITGEIIALPPADLVVFNNNFMTRTDSLNNILWSVPATGSPFYADSNFIYVKSSGNVSKFNSVNGSLIWSINASFIMQVSRKMAAYSPVVRQQEFQIRYATMILRAH